jgi:hypothetical protein
MSRRRWRKSGFTWDEKAAVLLVDVGISNGPKSPGELRFCREFRIFGAKSGDFAGWKNPVFWT